MFLTGCAHYKYKDPLSYKLLSTYRLRHDPDSMLCKMTKDFTRDISEANKLLIMDELKKRGLLTKKGVRAIYRSYKWEKYIIGMTQCAMYLVLGVPQTENKSVYSSGTHIQHIYVGYNDMYIYTDNGIVTSYQLSE
jgi:hypothetical protein